MNGPEIRVQILCANCRHLSHEMRMHVSDRTLDYYCRHSESPDYEKSRKTLLPRSPFTPNWCPFVTEDLKSQIESITRSNT